VHIIIGVGNTFVDSFLEWIEERLDQLHPDKVLARNKSMFAQIQYDTALEENEKWLENDGILFNDLILEKKQMKSMLDERVSFFMHSSSLFHFIY
jgi:hypothetical protein